MGGTDDPSNLVELTVEQHAEAHRLLWEQYGRWQDKLAWLGLSRQIGKEELHLQAIRESQRTKDTSYFQTDEWKTRVKQWMTGRTLSKETIEKMSKPKSENHRQKLRAHLSKFNQRPRDDEFRSKMSVVVKSTRKQCPFCDFESTATHVTRHIKRVHEDV